MRLEQIQAFLAVAESMSFQKAAQLCNVTQSTISRQVQALEAELQSPLFHRTGQVALTVAGELLLPHAKRIEKSWQTATEEISHLMTGKRKELCIAAIHSACAYFLPPLLEQFCQYHPEIQLRVTSLGSDRALKVLRDGLVDMAIVMSNRFLTSTPNLVVDVLYEEPIYVLMSAKHPLSQQKEVTWEQISQCSQVVFKDGYGMQRIVQEHFQKLQLPMDAALELNILDAFRGVVRQGNLVALLPKSALVDCEIDPLLVTRPTTAPYLSRQVVAVTTPDRLEIPPIQRFRSLLLKEFQPHLEQSIQPAATAL